MSPTLPQDEDRPKSPWTPSHFVTIQGSVAQDSVDLDQFEQLPPSIIESSVSPQVSAAEGTLLSGHSTQSVNEVEPDSQTTAPMPIGATTEPTGQAKDVLLEESNVVIDAEPEVSPQLVIYLFIY
jgi:hypothetical protein